MKNNVQIDYRNDFKTVLEFIVDSKFGKKNFIDLDSTSKNSLLTSYCKTKLSDRVEWSDCITENPEAHLILIKIMSCKSDFELLNLARDLKRSMKNFYYEACAEEYEEEAVEAIINSYGD